MLIDIKHMLSCLRRMQQPESDNADIELKQLCSDPLKIHHFRDIMADTNIEQPTKQMAAVFFKNHLLETMEEFQEHTLIEIVLGMVFDDRINYKLKIMLEDLIIGMVEWTAQDYLSDIIQCIEDVFVILKKASGKEDFEEQRKPKTRKFYEDQCRPNLTSLLKPIDNQQSFINLSFSLIHLLECLSSVQIIEFDFLHRIVRISLVPSLTIFPTERTQTYLRLQMVTLHMWLGYLQNIADRLDQEPELSVIQDQILEENSLWIKILESYELQSHNFTGVQGEENLLVCSNQYPESQTKIINKIKAYACRIHLILLQYEKGKMQFTHLDKTVSPAIFTRIIKTLSYFSLHKNMQTACFCETFINDLLTLSIFIIGEKKEIIDSSWTSLLHMIVFPLMTIDEKEYENFEDEPDEYIRIAEDCCDRQRLKELKTQAARLLELISDRSIAFSQYIVQFCCLSIQTQIFKHETNIENPASLLSIETSFMILSVLSYNLIQFKNEIQLLRTIILSPQCSQLTGVDVSRIFLFLSYNYGELFPNPNDGRPWITYALSSTLHYTTRISAMDFLLNIVDEYFEDEFIVLFSNKIAEEIEIKQIWDIVNKILNHHAQKISVDAYLIMIDKIFQRMSTEISRYKEKKIRNTANINSGLELLRKILTFAKNFKNDKTQIKNEILRVVPQYRRFKEIHLEDVVLKILNEFLEFTEFISEDFLKNYVEFDLIQEFKLQNYRPTPFYWIFNQFIFKEHRMQKLREIKNVLVEAFRSLYREYLNDKIKVKSNLPLGHTLLILQHMLVVHGEKFEPRQIYEIYNLCMAALPEDMHEPQKLNMSPLILGRVLILNVLCYMITFVHENVETKPTMNPLKYLLLFHDEDGVFEGHNARVIVKILCKLMFKESDPVSVTEMINIMVRVTRPKVKEQPKEKDKKKAFKNSTKFKIKSTENYEAILKKVLKPFDFSVTPENQLKTTLEIMKENNEPLYASIINYLPSKIKDKLRDILSTDKMGEMEDGVEKKRRIMRVGGIRTQAGYDGEGKNGFGKREKNFEGSEENEYEVDENENDVESIENDEESKEQRKNKMKNRKKQKKLKGNEFAETMEDNQN